RVNWDKYSVISTMIARISVPINVLFRILRIALSKPLASTGLRVKERRAACIFAKRTFFEYDTISECPRLPAFSDGWRILLQCCRLHTDKSLLIRTFGRYNQHSH